MVALSEAYARQFEARTKEARALCEPEFRRLLTEWEAKYGHLDGGSAPSMLRAMAETIGRYAAEILPDEVPSHEVHDLITLSVRAGMMEVLGSGGHGAVAHA